MENLFCWTSSWSDKFLFSHTNCILWSANVYTFKLEDPNLSLLFVYVSLVLINIRSEWIKKWGKKVRLVNVLSSKEELRNYSSGFGFCSFGDLGFHFFFFNLLGTFGLKYCSSGTLLSCLTFVHLDLQSRERVVFELSENR